jgi:hypothetical protein
MAYHLKKINAEVQFLQQKGLNHETDTLQCNHPPGVKYRRKS